MRVGEFAHALMELLACPARSRSIVIQREHNSLRIENLFAAHRVEVIDGHRRRPVGSKRAVNVANDNIAGARVVPRRRGKYFFADGFSGHDAEPICFRS